MVFIHSRFRQRRKGSQMKKGEIGEGVIEKVEFPNKGWIYPEDGERILIKNGVPGQKVQFLVQKKRKGKCEGRLLQL